jgi:hypothetical protein
MNFDNTRVVPVGATQFNATTPNGFYAKINDDVRKNNYDQLVLYRPPMNTGDYNILHGELCFSLSEKTLSNKFKFFTEKQVPTVFTALNGLYDANIKLIDEDGRKSDDVIQKELRQSIDEMVVFVGVSTKTVPYDAGKLGLAHDNPVIQTSGPVTVNNSSTQNLEPGDYVMAVLPPDDYQPRILNSRVGYSKEKRVLILDKYNGINSDIDKSLIDLVADVIGELIKMKHIDKKKEPVTINKSDSRKTSTVTKEIIASLFKGDVLDGFNTEMVRGQIWASMMHSQSRLVGRVMKRSAPGTPVDIDLRGHGL